MELRDRVCVVVGGGRGLGRSVALRLASSGAKVAVCARSLGEIEAVAAEARSHGARSEAVGCDVGQLESIRTAHRTIVQRLGTVDVLVYAAGTATPIGSTLAISEGDWVRALNVNLTGAFLWMKAVLPGMTERRQGKIVCVSTEVPAAGIAGFSAYSTSKAALETVALNMALEFAPAGLAINAVRPGAFSSVLMDSLIDQKDPLVSSAAGYFAGLREQGKLASPDVPARLVLSVLRSNHNGMVVDRNSPLGEQLLAL